MKKIIILLAAALSLLLLVFLLAGSPFVLNIVKQKVKSSIQTQFDVPVDIGTITGNLFYALEVRDIKIGRTAEMNRLRISYNLLKTISKEISIENLTIDGCAVDINKAESLIQHIPASDRGNEEKKPGWNFTAKKISVQHCAVSGSIAGQHLDIAFEMTGSIRSQNLYIDTLSMLMKNSYFLCCGRIPFNEDETLDINYNSKFFLDSFDLEGLLGTIASRGELTGSISRPRIVNETGLSISYGEEDLAGRISGSWQTPDFDSLALSAVLDIKTHPLEKGSSIQDEWRFTVDAQGRDLKGRLSSAYGSMRFSGSLYGDIQEPEFTGAFNGQFQYMDFSPHFQGKVIYKNKSLVLEGLHIRSPDIYARCDASIMTAGSQDITADLFISCKNIDLINRIAGLPRTISGRLTTSIRARGTLQKPYVISITELNDVKLFSEDVRAAFIKIAYKDHSIYLDSGIIASTRGILELGGLYKINDSSFSLSIKSDEIVFASPEIFDKDTVLLSGKASIDAELQGKTYNPRGRATLILTDIVYDTLLLGDHTLKLGFRDTTVDICLFDHRNSLELTADVRIKEPFLFSSKLKLRHFDLKEYINASEAYITGICNMNGTGIGFSDISALVSIDTIYAALPQSTVRNIGNITVTAEQGIIDIKPCVLGIRDKNISIRGQVPMDIENGIIDLHAEVPKIEIGDLLALIPDVPVIKGLVAVNVGVKGRFQAPQINGETVFENISYSTPGLTIDSVSGQFTFHNNHVEIDRITGRLNNGSLDINGYVDFSKQGLDLASVMVKASRVDLSNKDFGKAVMSGVLNTSIKKDTVRIIGNVVLNKGVYDVPFDHRSIIKMLTRVNQPPPEQADFLKRIFCDISVSAPEGVFITNNIADIAADLDLQIKGALSKINIYGTIATSRKGTIQYLGKKFDITDARVAFDNPYEINPVIDLSAVHYISSADGDYEIFLNVSGTAKEWRLELASSPALPEQDIISLLVIGQRRPGMQITKGGKGLDLKGAAKVYAVGVARTAIEKTAEQKLGIEKIVITGDLLKPRELDIGIEKRFAKKFTFIYGTGLETWELRRIGMNYDITDHFSIFTLHDQENLNSSVDLDIHFKLR